MPDASLLDVFPSPTSQPFLIEHINEEFTVTNQIRDDLTAAMSPKWLQVITDWRGRGGIRSRIVAAHGDVPSCWARA
jgi:NADPH-dependent 7-cyano-7-deazaguanine reductase QueF